MGHGWLRLGHGHLCRKWVQVIRTQQGHGLRAEIVENVIYAP